MADRTDTVIGVHLGVVTSIADGQLPAVQVDSVAAGYTYPCEVAAHVTGVFEGARVLVAITRDGAVIAGIIPTV